MDRTYITICTLFTFTTGCTPTVDGSSPEEARASFDRVKASVPTDKQEELTRAAMAMAMKNVKSLAELAEMDFNSSLMGLDGMSAEDIVAEHARIISERWQDQIKQMAQEVVELEAEKVASGAARDQLANFEIKRSRLLKKKHPEYHYQPTIELIVKNGTENSVSNAHFTGVLASPGRPVPWLKEKFKHEISGGIEPGERATWCLAPDISSAWGTVDAPNDAVLTVTVERLDGPDGKPLFENTFTEEDQERINELLAGIEKVKRDLTNSTAN